jgi:hypothetical protein
LHNILKAELRGISNYLYRLVYVVRSEAEEIRVNSCIRALTFLVGRDLHTEEQIPVAITVAIILRRVQQTL